MKVGSFSLTREAVKRMKKAYYNFYLKSRELNIPSQEQDIVLQSALKDIIGDVISKVSKEDEKYSEQRTIELFEEISKLTEKWKIEFDEEYYNKNLSGGYKKKAWWRFWEI